MIAPLAPELEEDFTVALLKAVVDDPVAVEEPDTDEPSNVGDADVVDSFDVAVMRK